VRPGLSHGNRDPWFAHPDSDLAIESGEPSNPSAEKMQAQLVYRDKSDKPVYGSVFTSGQNTIDIPNGARNNIVNLAVAVTNPNAASGGDDGSGKGFDAQEHFSYKARIVSGGTIAPTTIRPW
jgi:hypothetical protein